MKKIMNLSLSVLMIFGLLTSLISLLPAERLSEMIQEQKKESSEIKELTIRNSGFRSRSTVVIRYQDKDKKIVEVIENGKSVPLSEFPKYESIMRKVLELPQINQLLPEIDEAYRRAESLEISEEAKLDHLRDIMKELETMDSDVARRYRELTEFQLMESLHRWSEEISESSDLSQQEKIEKLKELLRQSREMELARQNKERRTRLIEFGVENTALRLIEEIKKSKEISYQEKIAEISSILQEMRHTYNEEEEAKIRRDALEFEATNAMRQMMLEELQQKKNLTEQEKLKEIQRLEDEANRMNLGEMKLMIGVEKFKFELHQLLKEKGLLPEEKAEFVLKLKETTINGKKLPKEIHEQILQLCEDTIGKEFKSDTKIVLQLNEER